MGAHLAAYTFNSPTRTSCDRCGEGPSIDVTHPDSEYGCWLDRLCLEEALSLLPDERSPRLRAYLALSEAQRQLQSLIESQEPGWQVDIRHILVSLGQLYDGMSDEECEIVDKREVQR